MTATEKEKLSKTVQEACEGKPIRKTEKNTMTEEEFNKAAEGNFDSTDVPSSRNLPRQLTGCKTVKVRNKYILAIFSIMNDGYILCSANMSNKKGKCMVWITTSWKSSTCNY